MHCKKANIPVFYAKQKINLSCPNINEKHKIEDFFLPFYVDLFLLIDASEVLWTFFLWKFWTKFTTVIVGTPPLTREMRFLKIIKKGDVAFFWKYGVGKRGNTQFFYCLECKADVSILWLLIKLALIECLI